MKYGYARVSTSDQNLDLQIRALEQVDCDRIFKDEISGAAVNRTALDELLNILAPGDEVVVWKLDRLGRSLAHLIDMITQWGERDIQFRSLTDGIDTTTAGGELQFHIMGALAQFERTLISERTKAGMVVAKSKGKHCGRRKKMSQDNAKMAFDMLEEGKSKGYVARFFKVSRPTLRKAVNELQLQGSA